MIDLSPGRIAVRVDGRTKAVRRGRCLSRRGPRRKLSATDLRATLESPALGEATQTVVLRVADDTPSESKAMVMTGAQGLGYSVREERLPEPLGPCAPEHEAKIRPSIVPHLGMVERCYDAVLRADGGLRGEVVVHFRVDPTGNVAWEEIGHSTLDSPALHKCLLTVVHGIIFAPRDPYPPLLYVRYPFRFGLD